MKMSYRQNNTKRNTLAVGVVLVLAVSTFYFWGHDLLRYFCGAHYVSEPLWKAGNRMSNTASSYSAFLDSKETLEGRNDELEKEVQELRLKLLSKDLLLKENKELKAILGRVSNQRAILATVLSRPNNSPYDTLIIDIGKDKGIEKGDKVLVAGEIVVGTVGEVYARSSKSGTVFFPGPHKRRCAGRKRYSRDR